MTWPSGPCITPARDPLAGTDPPIALTAEGRRLSLDKQEKALEAILDELRQHRPLASEEALQELRRIALGEAIP